MVWDLKFNSIRKSTKYGRMGERDHRIYFGDITPLTMKFTSNLDRIDKLGNYPPLSRFSCVRFSQHPPSLGGGQDTFLSDFKFQKLAKILKNWKIWTPAFRYTRVSRIMFRSLKYVPRYSEKKSNAKCQVTLHTTCELIHPIIQVYPNLWTYEIITVIFKKYWIPIHLTT